MLIAGVVSDKASPLRVFATLALTGSLALAVSSSLLGNLPALIGALVLAAAGLFSAVPIFWRICTQSLQGRSAAGGIALVNCIGSLSGFAGPALVGAIKQSTGGLLIPILAISAIAALAIIPLSFESRAKKRRHDFPAQTL